MHYLRRCGVALCCAISLGAITGTAHAAPVTGQGSWETTLEPRDFDGNTNTAEGYYDTLTGITWLADADYAGANMNFTSATAWASGLSVNGISGWRLPTISPINGVSFDFNYMVDGSTDLGYNISAPGTAHAGSTANELAHMFYNTLGNLGYYDTAGNAAQPGWGLTNTGPFANLTTFFYWTDTVDPANPTAGAFTFYENRGQLSSITQNASVKGWAVHDGDVGTAIDLGGGPVPVPAAAWLFGSGLIGLAAVGRRKRG